jgi:16S rRNA (guanine966-N2)-methyltransferase
MGNLRVIGGERKGFRIMSPRGSDLRPTSGRVRKALFDILGDDVREARFLDLFAGTGAVGIEALSRGASCCHFLEEDSSAARIIRKNLEDCGFGPRGLVILGKLPTTLTRLPPRMTFSLVFVDPPYGAREAQETLEALGRSGSLSTASKVILEHRKTWEPPALIGRLGLRRSVRYGDTVLSFFSMAGEKNAKEIQEV